MDAPRHALARRVRRRPAGAREAGPESGLCDRPFGRRLHHEPADPGPRERPGIRGVGLRLRAAASATRRSGPDGGAAPLLLEESEMGALHPLCRVRLTVLMRIAW